MSEYGGWTIERGDDGWWEVNGDGAPSHARWRDLPGCLEVAAEEARRLGMPMDMTVEVRSDTPYTMDVSHLIADCSA